MLSDKARKLGEEPAFPYAVREDTEAWSGGMTKREYFAAAVYSGLLRENGSRIDWQALLAVKQADALLEALAKGDQ